MRLEESNLRERSINRFSFSEMDSTMAVFPLRIARCGPIVEDGDGLDMRKASLSAIHRLNVG